MPLMKKAATVTATAATKSKSKSSKSSVISVDDDDVKVYDDTIVSDDTDVSEDSADTEEEESAEESEPEEEEEEEEEVFRPVKRGRTGGNSALAKIALVASNVQRKKQAVFKQSMERAITLISELLERHAAVIEKALEDGTFESDADGIHITVCPLSEKPELARIISDARNAYEWRDNLSNRIDESCGIEVSFGADNDLLVVTLQPEDDDY